MQIEGVKEIYYVHVNCSAYVKRMTFGEYTFEMSYGEFVATDVECRFCRFFTNSTIKLDERKF